MQLEIMKVVRSAQARVFDQRPPKKRPRPTTTSRGSWTRREMEGVTQPGQAWSVEVEARMFRLFLENLGHFATMSAGGPARRAVGDLLA